MAWSDSMNDGTGRPYGSPPSYADRPLRPLPQLQGGFQPSNLSMPGSPPVSPGAGGQKMPGAMIAAEGIKTASSIFNAKSQAKAAKYSADTQAEAMRSAASMNDAGNLRQQRYLENKDYMENLMYNKSLEYKDRNDRLNLSDDFASKGDRLFNDWSAGNPARINQDSIRDMLGYGDTFASQQIAAPRQTPLAYRPPLELVEPVNASIDPATNKPWTVDHRGGRNYG